MRNEKHVTNWGSKFIIIYMFIGGRNQTNVLYKRFLPLLRDLLQVFQRSD
jgi:hypothetical protein